MPCLINKRRIWTARILLESMCHGENVFVTLTYAEDRIPSDGSVDPSHGSGFIKRLRSRISPRKFRFFLVGEYGDRTGRPHYHVAMFGYPRCRRGPYGYETYDSGRVGRRCLCRSCSDVHQSWGFGFTSLSDLVPNRAAYIAKYVTKKLTSKNDERLSGRHPEFIRSSRMPGIGVPALERVVSAVSAEARLAIGTSIQLQGKEYPLGRLLKGKMYELAGAQPLSEGPLYKLRKNREKLRELRGVAEFSNIELETVLRFAFDKEIAGYQPKGTL